MLPLLFDYRFDFKLFNLIVQIAAFSKPFLFVDFARLYPATLLLLILA